MKKNELTKREIKIFNLIWLTILKISIGLSFMGVCIITWSPKIIVPTWLEVAICIGGFLSMTIMSVTEIKSEGDE